MASKKKVTKKVARSSDSKDTEALSWLLSALRARDLCLDLRKTAEEMRK